MRKIPRMMCSIIKIKRCFYRADASVVKTHPSSLQSETRVLRHIRGAFIKS